MEQHARWGLTGADKHCQNLATAAGAGNQPGAPISAPPLPTVSPAVNARDRIGKGPGTNAKASVYVRSVGRSAQ